MSIQDVYSNILFMLLFFIFIYIYFNVLYIVITYKLDKLKNFDKTIFLFLFLFCTLCIQLYYDDIIKDNIKTKFLYILFVIIIVISVVLILSIKFFIDLDKENNIYYIIISIICIILSPFIYFLFIL